MIRLSDISLPPEHSAHQLPFEAARMLRVPNSKIRGVRIVRRSVDARKKPNVRIIYTIDVTVDGSEKKILKQSGCKRASIAPATRYKPPKSACSPEKRPVVVGFGPGGMFAALILALAGWKPLVLERGENAASRHEKVEKFFQTGELDTKSNVQFGEGGAGTFSDGKLNTGVNNPRIGWILEQFVAAGAREDILYDAKPHVGTDVLLTVVQNLRKRIISLGGEVRFNTQVTGLCTENGRLIGLKIADGTVIPCDRAVLAIGHSARDTFAALHGNGVYFEPKAFSVGVRIEHLQTEIDRALYGKAAGHPMLPPAEYNLSRRADGRACYSFCMCPGGVVVAAQSEENTVVTNGMSYHARDGKNANAALAVSVDPKDYDDGTPFGGVALQRRIEHAAYTQTGSYRAPCQKVGDFLNGKPTRKLGAVKPSYPIGVELGEAAACLPDFAQTMLRDSLPYFGRKIRGYDTADALLTGPETRTSSPVRMTRGEDLFGLGCSGIIPCGEGAGYAGGIMSAAVDGIRAAFRIMEEFAD